MGLALVIAASGQSLTSGDEFSLIGYGTDSGTEVNTQVSCTEAATFSNLRARIISGNSGTATYRFRDAGANGQETIQITGTGTAEDTTNSDVLAAGDLFNIAYTDTGTNSGPAWCVGNILFSSGHGTFHGVANNGGIVCDAASTTTFFPFGGDLIADGNTTEDNVEWKVRADTSFEAFQVRVTANARTNTSTFRNRINGANGGLQIDYATLVTGLVTDSSPADSLADGDTINASLTLNTGVEDLTVTFVVATLKSSANKSDTWAVRNSGMARPASATAHYFTIGGLIQTSLTALTEANARIKVGFAAVVSNLRCYLSANTYTGNGTLKLYQNGSAVLTTTITASGGAAWYENATDTITIDDNDELSFEFDEGTSGSITIRAVGITFAPVAAAAGYFPPWPQIIYQPIRLQR